MVVCIGLLQMKKFFTFLVSFVIILSSGCTTYVVTNSSSAEINLDIAGLPRADLPASELIPFRNYLSEMDLNTKIDIFDLKTKVEAKGYFIDSTKWWMVDQTMKNEPQNIQLFLPSENKRNIYVNMVEIYYDENFHNRYIWVDFDNTRIGLDLGYRLSEKEKYAQSIREILRGEFGLSDSKIEKIIFDYEQGEDGVHHTVWYDNCKYLPDSPNCLNFSLLETFQKYSLKSLNTEFKKNWTGGGDDVLFLLDENNERLFSIWLITPNIHFIKGIDKCSHDIGIYEHGEILIDVTCDRITEIDQIKANIMQILETLGFPTDQIENMSFTKKKLPGES